MTTSLARQFGNEAVEAATATWPELLLGLGISGDQAPEFSKERILSCLTGPPQSTLAPDDMDDESEVDINSLSTRGTIPVLWRSAKPARESYFISLQKWQGVILDVFEETFLARLSDLDQQDPDEEAEILLDELSDDDLPLVSPGAVFYWHIGYHVDRSGQRKRASIIRFRRLPMWTAEEIEAARNDAEQTISRIGWK